MRFIRIKKHVSCIGATWKKIYSAQQIALAFVLSILCVAGCDNVSVVGDKDVDTGSTPRSVDTEEPNTPNEPSDQELPDDLASDSPVLLYLKDVNSDGIQDIALILEDSANEQLTATVKDTNNNFINNILFISNCRLLSAITLPDLNGDLGMELAVFCRHLSTGDLKVEIRDPLNGILIQEIGFSSEFQFLFTSAVEDMNGDGYPELAALLRGPQPDNQLFVQIRDPLSGAFVNEVGFDNQLKAKDFLSIPDINFSGTPELVLLGETEEGLFRSVIRDAHSSVLVSDKSLGSQFPVKQLSVAPNSDGSLIEEIAALREKISLNVLLYHAHDGSKSNIVDFDPSFDSRKLLIISDINRNGALELAVLGHSPDTGTIKSEVRDARTGDLLNNVFWPIFSLPVDIVTIADINFNGSQELVYLGKSQSDGKLALWIKDAMTSELLGTVDFQGEN